jgi:hypothetical protein
MKKSLCLTLAAASLCAFATPASAAIFIVKAFDHSSIGVSGTPLNTGLSLTTGQSLNVSSSLNDLWSAGALPRFSDANGLVADRFATALDDSGQPIGTQIGSGSFGIPSFGGHTAPFGSLVGRIGGVYQTLGANFNGTAWNNGTLELFYWDSNQGDNSGEIAFNISVPEPESWALMLLGFGLAGAAIRRRTVKFALS